MHGSYVIPERPAGLRMAVAGDLILDRYTWGNADRISPEAPIPVLRTDDDEVRPGGVASVAALLRAWEVEVQLFGVVGDDPEGATLRRVLDEQGIDTSGVVSVEGRPTTSKHRFLGRAGGRHPHQILRVDREVTADIGEDCAGRLADQLEGVLAGCDALLVSDYAKGVCTPALVRPILDRARFRSIPVLVDPGRGRPLEPYRGATLFKPNRMEASELAGVSILSPQDAVRAAQKLWERIGADVVAVTLDVDGIAYAAADASGVVPTAPRQAHDITGAGDMVLAMLGVGFAAGWRLEESLRIANTAAGLEIERLGIARVTWPEIAAALAPRSNPASQRKVCTLGEVSAIVGRFRQAGRTIAFTNGCFDLLHAGHLATLEFAAARADLLVVGLNSDGSVRRLKGPTRPLVPQAQRAALLAALGCVDHVVLFDDETPHRLLRALRPDVLIKGGSTGEIVGREVVESTGGQALHAPLVEGLSTTRLAGRMAGADR